MCLVALCSLMVSSHEALFEGTMPESRNKGQCGEVSRFIKCEHFL